MTLVTFETGILNETTSTLPTLYSLLWPLPPLLTFKFCKRVSTTWLLVTQVVDGLPSSVLLQGFYQSSFAILAIFPHTLAICVL